MSQEQLIVQNGGFSAPVNILKKGNGLSSTQKLILIAIHSFANPQKATASPSQNELADATGFTRETINKQIKELEKLGWIKKNRRFKLSPQGNMMNDINTYILIDKGSDLETLGSNPKSLGGSDSESLGVVSQSHNKDFDLKEILKRLIDNDKEENLIALNLVKELQKTFPHATMEFVISKWNDCYDLNPKSFSSYLATSLINGLKETKPTRTRKKIETPNNTKPRTRKPIRTEIVPDWLQQPQQQNSVQLTNIDEERKRLEKELEMFKSRRKKNV